MQKDLKMSGRKQHFIPQHYQQPFAIKDTESKIWIYRKGLPEPVSARIADAAAQRDFYSRPADDGLPTLDDMITEYEKTMHITVNDLRLLEVGDVIDSVIIAEVITHLSIRSSYTRGMVEDVVASMAGTIGSAAEGVVDGKTIRLPAHKAPSKFEKLILEKLEELGLLELIPVDGRTLAKLTYFALREGTEPFLSEARGLIGQLLSEFSSESSKLSHRTQASVLSESMAPVARIENLAALEWKVVASSNGCSILPDSTSIAYDGNMWASLLLTENEKLHTVVLPLTPERLAVGTRKGCDAPSLIDFDQIAAETSHTFFLSSERREELDSFLHELGGGVNGQVSSLTNGAMTHAVDDMLKADPHMLYEAHTQNAANNSWSVPQNEEPISFSLQLFDFGDKTLANEISEAVGLVVSSFFRDLPVYDLNGFVFANDYRAALKSVERGFEAKNDLEPLKSENVIGVSMPILVNLEGKIKTTAVCHSSIAVNLISDDKDLKAEATSIILHNLSSAALTGLLQNKFPDQMFSDMGDEYEGTLYQYTRGVFESYFCAVISGSIPSYVQFYEELAVKALKDVLEFVPVELDKFHDHGQMDAMFPAVAGLLADFLITTARFLGALRNQSIEFDEDSKLWHLLETNYLLYWVKLFQKDLKSFDEGLEAWSQFDEAFFANRHFERVAVQFGIFLESAEGSGIYVQLTEAPDMTKIFGSKS